MDFSEATLTEQLRSELSGDISVVQIEVATDDLSTLLHIARSRERGGMMQHRSTRWHRLLRFVVSLFRGQFVWDCSSLRLARLYRQMTERLREIGDSEQMYRWAVLHSGRERHGISTPLRLVIVFPDHQLAHE